MADVAGHGTPYWVAARLTATARANWHSFDGWAASRNVDPLDLPVDRYLNLVYYWLTRNISSEQRRQQFEQDLTEPPANETAVESGAWSADEEMDAFTKAMQVTGG